MTALINAYSALRIPLLAFVTPQVVELGETRSMVRIRLDLRSRNHLGVMYFGALAMGAELSVALKALKAISDSRKKIDFIFKDFQCEFLKRADGHTHFVCDQAPAVAALIGSASADFERHTKTFEGFAFVPSKGGESEPVMKYKVTLSVKQRKKPSD